MESLLRSVLEASITIKTPWCEAQLSSLLQGSPPPRTKEELSSLLQQHLNISLREALRPVQNLHSNPKMKLLQEIFVKHIKYHKLTLEGGKVDEKNLAEVLIRLITLSVQCVTAGCFTHAQGQDTSKKDDAKLFLTETEVTTGGTSSVKAVVGGRRRRRRRRFHVHHRHRYRCTPQPKTVVIL